ncbi:MAG: adenylyl-sulfate kinase [Oscillospiraceae bacterium]|nr:adenylyl-sulfate kinase [Oscillospiraceae bacterium]
MSAIWIPKRLVEIKLVNAAAVDKVSFIRHCEFEYESRIYAAAKEIMASGKRIVMLTGPSASGKTTTSNKIAEKIRTMGKKAQVLSMDNFFKNPEVYPRLADGTKDYENVQAVDIELMEKCLNEILETGKSVMPAFDFKTERRVENAITMDIGDGIIIVEGIHALNPAVLGNLSREQVFTIYAGLREEYSHQGQRVLPTRDIRMVRRMIRDFKHRGHSPEKTIAMWQSVCDGEDKYIKPFKPNADLLLDTSFSYEILVMNSALKNLSAGLKDGSPESERLEKLIRVFNNCDFIPEGYLLSNSMLKEFYC